MKTDLDDKLFAFWNDNYEYYSIAEQVEYEPYLVAARKKLVEAIVADSIVLDVACGSGLLLKDISAMAKYFGVDISDAALKLALKRKNNNSHLVKTDVSKLPFKDETVDVSLCVNSLEHFTDPKSVIDEMWRITKKNGKIIFISPNWGDYIFKAPPSLSCNRSLLIKTKYIFNQFLMQTLRMINRRSFFFPIFDCSAALKERFVPDIDAIYAVSMREIENYFRYKGASHINVDLRNQFNLALPLRKNIAKNMLRAFKRVNSYYKYHGANLIIVTK